MGLLAKPNSPASGAPASNSAASPAPAAAASDPASTAQATVPATPAPASPSWPLPRLLQADEVPHLRYLVAVVKEAMRMLPVVSVMSK